MSTDPAQDPKSDKALRRHVFGTPDDPVPDLMPENAEAIRRYVIWKRRERRYLKLLGGLPEREGAFNTALVSDAREISDEDLDRLLSCGWRPRLTAAWLIGIDCRRHYREALGELLLESASPYAGQGYCFALARFGQVEDAEILVAYLDRYLPRTDCYYDQLWAMGALLYLDEQLDAHHAERFIATGLWQSSVYSDIDPAACQETVADCCKIISGMVDGNV